MSTYVAGQWKAVCDRCGFERMSADLRLEWTGLRVCRDTCFEHRNVQEKVRGRADRQAPPWTRPDDGGTVLPIWIITDWQLFVDGAVVTSVPPTYGH